MGRQVVRKRGRAEQLCRHGRARADAPPPARRQPARAGSCREAATSISRKRARLQRAEPAAEPEPDDPEAAAAMRAWLERAKWGHGPAR